MSFHASRTRSLFRDGLFSPAHFMTRPTPVQLPGKPKPGRASVLITDVIASGAIDGESLARELAITPALLERYSSGLEEMPLKRQARLALFVIERMPLFLRAGNRLRGQVAAAMAYHAHETETHR